MSDDEWAEAVRALRYGRGDAAAARNYCRSRHVRVHAHSLGFAYHLGYPAVVARAYRAGEIVSEAYRYYDTAPLKPGGERWKDKLLRRGPGSSGWIGVAPPDDDWVLLCAGFFDGFSARQHGLPAVSAIGANLPVHLVADLAGRRVAVAYDVGEEAAAARSAALLQGAGSEAWVVHLARLGLPPGGDLNDFLVHGGSPADVRDLVARERAVQ